MKIGCSNRLFDIGPTLREKPPCQLQAAQARCTIYRLCIIREKLHVHKLLAGKPRPAGIHNSGGKTKKSTTNLILASWNVRTLLDNEERPERRTALISRELERYKIDIAALQETRFSDQGQFKEKTHTYYWSGKPSGERTEAGVAFAISNHLVKELESLPTGKNDRLISLRIHIGQQRYLTLISAYAPTLTNGNETKELFYRSLDSLLSETPAADKLILLGDFNARVGKYHEAWPQTLGKFGRGKMNSNGEMLLTKCSEYQLAITNTFFNFSDKWYYSWKHPSTLLSCTTSFLGDLI